VVETSCRAERLILPEVLDAEVREVVRDGVDKGLEDGFLVVADDEDFFDFGNARDSTEAVLNNGVACDREERLSYHLVGCGRAMQLQR
jgi:hypothetical protein